MRTYSMKITVLLIQGLVQGVGFRPFVYRIAREMGVRGEVDNRNDGVLVKAVLSPVEKERFKERIRTEHPPVACVEQIVELEPEEKTTSYDRFSIAPSLSGATGITQVSPDIAVCPDCLADRRRQPHRLDYPFINCTHCGPRFTLIRDLPYDRPHTTMSVFPLCAACRNEYHDAADRRFHAQPVACRHCGPVYQAYIEGTACTDYAVLLDVSARLLEAGAVIAAKGIGGYHLACDACNEDAVMRLRQVKGRDRKPFAVMFRDLATAKNYIRANAVEEACLVSWRRPVVILEQKTAGICRKLASSVNPGMRTLGCLLPYMPLHYDWFERLDTPALVLTSGNLSGSPLAADAKEAYEQLAGKAALILHHNREIYHRVDDSVVQVCGSQPCLLRRARGYAPEPVAAGVSTEGLLAFGAETVNTFAAGKGEDVLLSQYIGDLQQEDTFRFYTRAMERFCRLFRLQPAALACDLHPDYFSSQAAERRAEVSGLPLYRVQHHHAHAAACMLEYDLHEPVVAMVLDGTGLGDDGCVWGGEFFLCDRAEYRRLSHLEYVPLPGNDKAAGEPWRMAAAYLWKYRIPPPPAWSERIGKERIGLLERMMERGVNSPATSGAGRLFDAVASLTGVCDVAERQAEGAILLEQAVPAGAEEEAYRFPLSATTGRGGSLSFAPLIRQVAEDVATGIPSGIVSARFHETLAQVLKAKACELVRATGASEVVVSGGCFQNKRLTERLQRLFAAADVPLRVPQRIPCNDGGIAAGQLTVAAERRRRQTMAGKTANR